MKTENLEGGDLLYWVARANLRGSYQERNVRRRDYGNAVVPSPASEASMRDFVMRIIGPDLPARGTWQ